ncbi:zinc ABC transporter substrate-binding protein [Candidatus Saccharibacteria bacterium]|nr:zinc ABC transporter substrate-binding protein [Candidatus Saccharibacteria bacterium]
MNKKGSGKIVATNFAAFDFARAVIGDSSDITILLKPGMEMHDFEPTPEDIKKVLSADLFIYVGGESDVWVEKLLNDNEIKKENNFRMMEFVSPLAEEFVKDTKEDEHAPEEKDEHIWTSPVNAVKLVEAVRDRLIGLYPEKEQIFTKNAKIYTEQLKEIDNEFRDIANNSTNKLLVFADRFPFLYFTHEYGLSYFAAFPGCAEQTEASSNVIASLVGEVKGNNIKTILKIELTSDKLAKSIADETGAKILELNAAHNISQENFDRGVTYADIMRKNISVLREALKNE